MTCIHLTKEQLISFKPCGLEYHLSLFSGRRSLTVRTAIKAGVSVSDILWVAGRLGEFEKIVEFAKGCANSAAASAASARYAVNSAASAADYANSADYADYANSDANSAADYVNSAASARYAANAAADSANSAARYAVSAASAAASAYIFAEEKRQLDHLVKLFG